MVVEVAALILLACSAVSAVTPPDEVAGNLVFLESSDAKGKLPRSKIVSSMTELARQMKLLPHQLPRVLVLHVSREAASAVGVRHTSLRRNSGDVAAPYFELWIVGDANAADYTYAFEQVLERHCALQVSEAERKRVVTHVVKYLNATVSVSGE